MHTGTVQILLKLQNMTHLTYVSGDNSQCSGKKKMTADVRAIFGGEK